MKKHYHKERICFRFVNLAPQLLSSLRKLMSGQVLKTSRLKTTKEHVVYFEVRKKMKLKLLCDFIQKNNIDSQKYGVWISLVTELDSDGVHVPDFAVDLIRSTEGKLDFSFTSV